MNFTQAFNEVENFRDTYRPGTTFSLTATMIASEDENFIALTLYLHAKNNYSFPGRTITGESFKEILLKLHKNLPDSTLENINIETE